MKMPICMYLIKHPEFEDSEKYIHDIYSNIYRNYENPMEIKNLVPVYFTNSNTIEENQIEIDFNCANHIAIFIIIDKKMILDRRNGWKDYIAALVTKVECNKHARIFPIAVEDKVINIFRSELREYNFIRLYEKKDEQRLDYLIFSIKHDLCRMLFDIESASDVSKVTPCPVKLFLSHAKRDGKKIIEVLRKYINNDTGIQDFFDAVDIEHGSKFLQRIKEHIGESNLLLAIHTDYYGNSEWCKKEVLVAKKERIPVLVVNYLKNGENRVFPYLGNTKSICISNISDNNCLQILSEAMSEILNKEAYRLNVQEWIDFCHLDQEKYEIYNYAPELLQIREMEKNEGKYVVYPEPPLGIFETELLHTLVPNLHFITPSMLLSATEEIKLIHKKVAISISETSTFCKHGIENIHCRNMNIELARYLFHCGVSLSYGGNLNYTHGDNFAKDLICLAENYYQQYGEQKIIRNYVAGYLVPQNSDELQLNYSDTVEFVLMPPSHKKFKKHKSKYNGDDINRALDLMNMRKRMTRESDARIVLGGKMEDFSGRYPGILEEVLCSIELKKPLFILGGFGGMAAQIVKCIMGETNVITDGTLKKREMERDFSTYYNEQNMEDVNRINYSQVSDELRHLTCADLRNGLTDEENRVIFESRNINEIIGYILKGLTNIK